MSSSVATSGALLCFCAVAWLGPTGFAQMQASRVFPSAVSHGETSLRIEGKFPTWPVQAMSDRQDVHVECTSESGMVRVAVDPQAPPGVAWLRFADDQSSSTLLPLVISSVPVLEEQEPASEFDVQAFQELDAPSAVVGKLAKSGDSDSYRISLSPDQPIHVRLMAHNLLQSPMDAVLQISDLDGHVLAQNDDEWGLDPALTFLAPAAGEYLIRIFAFPAAPNSTIGLAGGADYVYLLEIGSGRQADHYLPLVACDQQPATAFTALPDGEAAGRVDGVQMHQVGKHSPPTLWIPGQTRWQWLAAMGAASWPSVLESPAAADNAQAVAPPVVLSGHIRTRQEVDQFALRLQAGKKIRATVVAREFGFPLDSMLRLSDSHSEQELARSDDVSRNDYDSRLEYTPKQDQLVYLQVSDAVGGWGPRHAYSVMVELVEPRVSLTVSSDNFRIAQGSSLEIPIAITRLDGFADPLTLEVTGLPEGVQADPLSVTADAKSPIQLKLLATEETQLAQAEIGIVARKAPLDAEQVQEREADAELWSQQVFHALRPGLRLKSFWLVVEPKSEPSK